ncbi:MAG: STAS domain-containing protein [Gammaproteobacteria bacterium]|nr:STAS domain-containing protein [Gammaproteobacteria bacterium]
MSMDIDIRDNSSEVYIRVTGHFDFDSHEDFHEALTAANSNNYSKYTVDLGSVKDLDSSALGMLLLLRESAGGESADISIVNCRSEIREILKIANFQQMFHIH